MGGIAAVGGLCAIPALDDALGPRLRFGVVSDVHIGGRKEAPLRLAFALRWLRARGVDAVLFPGDIAHTGRISQMEEFARIWFEVFPEGLGLDGRKVELMISTGNHDAWTLGYDKASEADRRANWLVYGDNLPRTWRRLFGLAWAPVWRRAVKGYVFMGSEWPTLKPDLEGYMREHCAEFDRSKPFFHCQHEHPKDTCHGAYGCGWDQGQAARAFADFPNAVVFSGHSHCSLADERTIWQGAFTSVGAGCLHEGGGSFDYENISAFWHPSFKTHVMAPMNDSAQWGGDPDGGCFELVEVFDDCLRIERRSSVWDLPIGPAWTVPLPARTKGSYDHARLAAASRPPTFPSSATVSVAYCPNGHPQAGASFGRTACVHLAFPSAGCGKGRRRVFDYEVRAVAPDGRSVVRKIMAPGFSVPEEKSNRPVDCLFLLSELPSADGVVFKVTPRDCFGNCGPAITSERFVARVVPAFTMRIDDNQSVADWRRVAEIFEIVRVPGANL